MTAVDRVTNIARFEQGDRPQGSDFRDLVDSFLSLADTTAQAMNSDLSVPTLIAAAVSAGTVNASVINASQVSAATLTGSVHASVVSGASVVADSLFVQSSAAVSGRMTSFEYIVFSRAAVTAAGSGQATGAQLGARQVHVIAGVLATANGDSLVLSGGYPGLTQIIINPTNVTAQLFPPSGGIINSAAANAAVGLFPASISIIYHQTSAQFRAGRLTNLN